MSKHKDISMRSKQPKKKGAARTAAVGEAVQPPEHLRDRVGELVRIPAGEIAGAPWNWRAHPQRQEAAVVASLEELGIYAPLLGRRLPAGNVELIDGHLRRTIFAKVGPDTLVPIVLCDLDEAEAKKANLLHDPLAGLAEVDKEKLDGLLREVSTGSPELQQMFADMADSAGLYQGGGVAPEEDEVPAVPEEAITKPGDLWVLGEHRLLCGDSTKAEDVARVLAGVQIDMVLSDPPYGVSYVGKTKDALTVENDALDEDALTVLITSAFDHAQANCRGGAYWYATVPAGPAHILFAHDWKRRGILRQIMVWAKDSMVLGYSEYHYKHEPILFGWIPGGDRHKNSDRTRTTVWEYARPKASREHPTMKPIALWAQAVNDGSRPGEMIYDPFLGSGTTLIAAEQLGRKCCGLEISPNYCDVIVARWEALTGKKATLAPDAPIAAGSE